MSESTEEKTKPGRLRDIAAGTSTGYDIDPRIVNITDGFNVRDFSLKENQEHVKQLSESIAREGVLNPIVIRYHEGDVYLVDGESRLRATLLAIQNGNDIKSIPAITERKATSEQDRIASLVTRNSGKQLTILERAEVIARLKKFGMKDADIAAKIGMTAATVSNDMMLYTGPEQLKKLVREGKLSGTLAVAAIRDHGDKALEALSEAVDNAKDNGKARVTARDIKTKSTKPKRNPYSFDATQSKTLYGSVVDLYYKLKGNENRKFRDVCRNVLEGIHGDKWQELAKAYADDYGLA